MNADDRNRLPGAHRPEEGDLLGWRTGRRRWVRLDPNDERLCDDVDERLEDADLDVGEIEVLAAGEERRTRGSDRDPVARVGVPKG